MNHVIMLLVAFLGLGLVGDRLGKRWSYALMALAIGVYVLYTLRTHNLSAL